MNKQPKISVIMPVYNAERYLAESLESLRYQTMPNFEVICVDDGSDDRSVAILQEYAEQDTRFLYLSQDHSYAGTARNFGISCARGEYVIFLDADDRFLPKMLETTYSRAFQTNADICIFPAEGFDDKTGKVRHLSNTCRPTGLQKNVFSRNDDPDHIFWFTNAAPWNKLFNLEFVKRNGFQFQSLPNSNDLSFVYSAISSASRITTVDQPLLQYRMNNAASLQGAQEKDYYFYNALMELKTLLIEHSLYSEVERAFVNLAASVIFYNLLSAKTTGGFEKLYYIIKNTVLFELNMVGRDPEFFFKVEEEDYSEMIRCMQEKSILDFVMRFPCSWQKQDEYIKFWKRPAISELIHKFQNRI